MAQALLRTKSLPARIRESFPNQAVNTVSTVRGAIAPEGQVTHGLYGAYYRS